MIDWDKWLIATEDKLYGLGYRKYHKGLKNEDFAYWKTFKDEDKKIYQVGVLFYDFRKYSNLNKISTQYTCMLLCDDRIDLDVSKGISITEFEAMVNTFYQSMKIYTQII